MKNVTFLASLIAVLSFMLISVGEAQAHPGCQGVGFEDKEDCDGDCDRQLFEEEEGEEEESGLLVGDDCEDDDAERATLDECEDDDDSSRATLDDCEEGDEESRVVTLDDCEDEEDEG